MSRKAAPRKYAHGTKVPAENSQHEIRRLLIQHGATSFGLLETASVSSIVCEFKARRLKFDVARTKDEAEYRRMWRVVLLRVKVRLEEVAEGSVTVDESFMPWIVLPNGHTVSESVAPAIKSAYIEGKISPLLLTYQ